MSDQSEQAPGATPEYEAEGLSGLIADARRLADEARTLAEAELAYQKARAGFAASAAAGIAFKGLVAFVLAVFALGALVVGLLLALATVIGPWWATLVVAGGLFVLALAFALAARARWTRTLSLIAPRDASDA